jgi:chitinase
MHYKYLVVLAVCSLALLGLWSNSDQSSDNGNFKLSMFYCGFSGDFCGQSTYDDVHPSSSIVIMAFANTVANGAITVDDAHFPTASVRNWQSSGKKVVLSVGGQNGNWNAVFASTTSIQNFITSVGQQINRHQLDGIDLDIEMYNAPPATVARMINQLRTELNKLGKKLIIVSPEDIAVYQGSAVPDPSKGGQPFNYFVPIIQ